MTYYGVDQEQMHAGLTNPNRALRCEALELVGEFGPSGAEFFQYGALVESMLEDPDEEVALLACKTLSLLGDAGTPSARRVLNWMASTDPKRRVCMATTLGRLKASTYAEEITRRLSDEHFAVRGAACTALAEIGAPDSLEAVAKELGDAVPKVASCAVTGLANFGDDGAKYEAEVAKLLSSSSKELRAAAAEYFARFKEAALKHMEPISKLLSDPDLMVRQKAVSVFAALGAEAAPVVSSVAQALPSTAAALALGHIGAAEDAAAEKVAAMLEDVAEDASQRALVAAGIETKAPPAFTIPACAAIIALMKMKPSKYASRVLAILNGITSPAVKECALRAIGEVGQADYEEKALVFLQAPHPRVRAAAVYALGEIASKHGASADVTSRAADLLVDEASAVRTAAAEAIGKMGDEGAAYTEAILSLFSDRAVPTKVAAITAMAKLGIKGTMYATEVARKLRDEYVAVQVAATKALAEMGERGAAFADEIAKLALSPDVDQSVKVEALYALAYMNAGELNRVAEIAKADPLPLVRDAVVKALESASARENKLPPSVPDGE